MDLRNIILGFIGIVVILYIFFTVAYSETHYERIATYKGNSTFTDTCGYDWKYDGNFKKDSKYELKMFTNHTDSIITDDVIVSVNEIK